jgi:hypothetical protein
MHRRVEAARQYAAPFAVKLKSDGVFTIRDLAQATLQDWQVIRPLEVSYTETIHTNLIQLLLT